MIANWKVAALRATLLRPGILSRLPTSRWGALFGSDPDTVTTQRGEIREETGRLGGNVVICLTTLVRTDWIVRPDVGEDPSVSVSSDVEDVHPFATLVERALDEETEPLGRLAYGATLLQPVGTREAGYELLTPYLPSLKIDPHGSSDLTYQINRSRMSRVEPGMRLNRLSKWVVTVVQQQMLLPVGGGQMATAPMISGLFAARVDLDVNTAPDWTEGLAKERTKSYWRELIELGREIAEQGDVP